MRGKEVEKGDGGGVPLPRNIADCVVGGVYGTDWMGRAGSRPGSASLGRGRGSEGAGGRLRGLAVEGELRLQELVEGCLQRGLALFRRHEGAH